MTFVVLKLLPAICTDFKWQFSHEVWIKCIHFCVISLKRCENNVSNVLRGAGEEKRSILKQTKPKIKWKSIPIAKLSRQLYYFSRYCQKRENHTHSSISKTTYTRIFRTVFKRIMKFDFNVRHLFHIIKPSLTGEIESACHWQTHKKSKSEQKFLRLIRVICIM